MLQHTFDAFCHYPKARRVQAPSAWPGVWQSAERRLSAQDYWTRDGVVPPCVVPGTEGGARCCHAGPAQAWCRWIAGAGGAGVGVVDSCGPGVTDVRLGQRVLVSRMDQAQGQGSWQERVCTQAAHVVRCRLSSGATHAHAHGARPEQLPYRCQCQTRCPTSWRHRATSTPSPRAPFGCAWLLPDFLALLWRTQRQRTAADEWAPLRRHCLLAQADVPRGAWLVQSAAASAIGLLIAQLARHRGVRTIAVVRRESARQTALAAG